MTAPGQQAGRYQVLGLLGEGGFATVYRAWDRMLGRQVALKALQPHLLANHEVLHRFFAEVRAVAPLSHPNIVAFHDAGELDGRPFYSMELVEGQTLADLTDGGRPLPVAQTVAFIRRLASAIDYLHAAGIVHRDIKPANVMVDKTGRVVLMDFGIVRLLESGGLTRPGAMLGTPEYMAPEQVQGHGEGPATDLYALGILAYQLLTGTPPFTGSYAYVLHAHVYDPPQPLSARRPELPPVFDAILARALAKSPRYRQPGAVAFAEELVQASRVLTTSVPETAPLRLQDLRAALADLGAATPPPRPATAAPPPPPAPVVSQPPAAAAVPPSPPPAAAPPEPPPQVTVRVQRPPAVRRQPAASQPVAAPAPRQPIAQPLPPAAAPAARQAPPAPEPPPEPSPPVTERVERPLPPAAEQPAVPVPVADQLPPAAAPPRAVPPPPPQVTERMQRPPEIPPPPAEVLPPPPQSTPEPEPVAAGPSPFAFRPLLPAQPPPDLPATATGSDQQPAARSALWSGDHAEPDGTPTTAAAIEGAPAPAEPAPQSTVESTQRIPKEARPLLPAETPPGDQSMDGGPDERQPAAPVPVAAAAVQDADVAAASPAPAERPRPLPRSRPPTRRRRRPLLLAAAAALVLAAIGGALVSMGGGAQTAPASATVTVVLAGAVATSSAAATATVTPVPATATATAPPAPAAVTELAVYDNAERGARDRFLVGDTLFVCFQYAPGGTVRPLAVIIAPGEQAAAGAPVARLDSISPQAGSVCQSVPVTAPPLLPGIYTAEVSEAGRRLASAGFEVLAPPPPPPPPPPTPTAPPATAAPRTATPAQSVFQPTAPPTPARTATPPPPPVATAAPTAAPTVAPTAASTAAPPPTPPVVTRVPTARATLVPAAGP